MTTKMLNHGSPRSARRPVECVVPDWKQDNLVELHGVPSVCSLASPLSISPSIYLNADMYNKYSAQRSPSRLHVKGTEGRGRDVPSDTNKHLRTWLFGTKSRYLSHMWNFIQKANLRGSLCLQEPTGVLTRLISKRIQTLISTQ